ncbi:hypothetical protein CLOBOL_00999 [Enterocloster bolteae ATCC BAA-613]|uniref:Uncharacterized protein n=1 Tax=Enterocloster bolteae (strain ATCC BAA-613 / DSM 15670 / CCUG 46953 / JCM 12243 / WAL 16351) TaxID=411902 RepID=A8RJR4_ENTBW|nr:hypothetical protein CLOBOL_00999 [Enterocloster bolteae ATCC BAA-613]
MRLLNIRLYIDKYNVLVILWKKYKKSYNIQKFLGTLIFT